MVIKLNLTVLCLLCLAIILSSSSIFAKENYYDAERREGGVSLAQYSDEDASVPLTVEDSPNDPANAWRELLHKIFIVGIIIVILWLVLNSLAKR